MSDECGHFAVSLSCSRRSTEAGSCCACGNFARACAGVQWTCASPSQNPPACPATRPTYLDACTDIDLVCWYCTDEAGPVRTTCVGASGFSECQMTGAASCWYPAGVGGGCD